VKPSRALWTLAALAGAATAAGQSTQRKASRDLMPSLSVDTNNLGTAGSNPYFVLEPGFRLHYAHGTARLTSTVLAETKTIDGIQTRVVEDREEKDLKPVEVTRDYYAIDRSAGDVYYFGEDVDVYKGGKVAGHEGSWLAGAGDAAFGLMMPARVVVGDRFYQELAPGRAMDRSEVVAVGETVATPAGTFRNCVHLRDSSAIEKSAKDDKWYAPGVGLVKDNELVLVRIDRPGR